MTTKSPDDIQTFSHLIKIVHYQKISKEALLSTLYRELSWDYEHKTFNRIFDVTVAQRVLWNSLLSYISDRAYACSLIVFIFTCRQSLCRGAVFDNKQITIDKNRQYSTFHLKNFSSFFSLSLLMLDEIRKGPIKYIRLSLRSMAPQ